MRLNFYWIDVMDCKPIPLDSIIIIDDDNDDVAGSSSSSSGSDVNETTLGVISFHFPYMMQREERIGLNCDDITKRIEYSLVKAVIYSISDDNVNGIDEKMQNNLDELYADVSVSYLGKNDWLTSDDERSCHMFECVITVSAEKCSHNMMDCLLYISSRMFKFGRQNARKGRYWSAKYGIMVESMECMNYIIRTLFCVPNKKDN